ncbi:hypothetical protein NSA47_03295 [Irregularibacter muris]|uniref:Cell division protein FtsL n=1 Tax=Irregularibacter muris TaxID=1796619 RepID=A0AAE3HEN3_9FIRM|nr:hypothetical protein [Irregularibacter muris]MCR1898014.1 hypothetical protein [Irregularibacter muris]
MLVAEKRNYQYALEEPVYKPNRKPKSNSKSKTKTHAKTKRIVKVKYMAFTMLIFVVALTILFQYTKLNTMNAEILNLEQELNELHMLTDSVEGQLLASEDLGKIEDIAKNQLGMIEPTAEQMVPIKVSHSENAKLGASNSNTTPNHDNSVAFLSKILNFID